MFETRASAPGRFSTSTDSVWIISGHTPRGSCSPAAKSEPRKDAGSVRSRRLRARLRTPRGDALQRARGRQRGERGTPSKLQSSFSRGLRERLHASVVEVAGAVEDDALDAGLLRVRG